MSPTASTEKTAVPTEGTETKPNETVTTPAGTPTEQKPTADAAQKPEWVPDKFWKDGKVDTEGLAKSYAELEKKTAEPTKTPETKPTDANGPEGEEAFKPFFKEFEETGALSEKSFEALQKIGLPKGVVEQYIAGIQASQAAAEARIFDSVGGKETYERMATWAKENLSPAEIAAYNKALVGGEAEASLAVSGKPVKLLGGQSSGSGSTQAFKSWAQVTEAMGDPRYKEDPAYRDEVSQRLAVSDL
jgi:hypothetical protein